MRTRSTPRGPRTVVVTGASSGIGRLTAQAFAARGDQVVLAARSASSLDDVARECNDAGAAAAVAVPTDVASYEDVEALAERTVRELGRIDVWVNNAAVIAYGAIDEIPQAVLRQVIDINLLGQLHGARAAVAQFKRQDAGVLVNVASLYARMATPFVTPYVVSKFGVVGLSRVLHQELSHNRHIHVCTVLPGSVDTPIFRHAATYRGRRPRPIPPVSDPERVARAIVSLANRPRPEVIVGQVHRALSWGRGLAPPLYRRLAPIAMQVAGWSRERAESSDGNVMAPVPEWNRSYGDWRHPLRRAAGGLMAAAVTAGVGGIIIRGRTPARRGKRG